MSELRIASIEQIQETAIEFLKAIKNNRIIAFFGDMGAGKTTFIKAICNALEVKNEVTSPTFTIVNEYESPQYSPIYHFDFYRIESINELFDIGFYEYLDSGELIFFEWSEKIENYLPENVLKVYLKIEETGERIVRF